MAIRLKTRVILWGRAAACCSFPGCNHDLVMDATETDDESLVGDIAHIVAESEDGPRGKSDVGPEERNEYPNLILLCKIHHKLVDDQPSTYTVEKLHEFKRAHEGKIRSVHSPDDLAQQRAKEVYASFVDEWEAMARIDGWKAWTSFMLAANGPSINLDIGNSLVATVEWILNRIWPKEFVEMEAAFENFRLVLGDLLNVFHLYSERKDDRYYTRRFYRIHDWDPDRYHELLDSYEYHVRLVADLVLELTRAANLVCDMVRRYFDPSFRMREGILLVESGPYAPDLSIRVHRVEYRQAERAGKPYPGLEKFETLRLTRDHHFGGLPKKGDA